MAAEDGIENVDKYEYHVGRKMLLGPVRDIVWARNFPTVMLLIAF